MCLHMARGAGDELAVFSCYFIKVRYLFEFTAPLWQHIIAFMQHRWWLEASSVLCGRSGRKGVWVAHGLLWIATHILVESSGWDASVGKSAFFLSSFPTFPSAVLLGLAITRWGFPTCPSLTICQSYWYTTSIPHTPPQP